VSMTTPNNPAPSSAAAVREALGFDTGDDASLNLQAALDELVSDRYKLADGGVIERTLQRVINQIEAIRVLPLPEPDEAGGEAVAITREMFDFLTGAGPLEGYYFGEKPETERGVWWWRKRLHDMAATKPTGDEPVASRIDPDRAIEVGRQMDEEDGGYPADEPIGLREAVTRLTKFRDEWAKMRNTGDDIQGLHMGDDREAILRSSDIGIILSALTTPSQPDEAAQPDDDAWMLAHEVDDTSPELRVIDTVAQAITDAIIAQDDTGKRVTLEDGRIAYLDQGPTDMRDVAVAAIKAMPDRQSSDRERIVAWLRYLAGVFVTPSVLASFGDTAGRDSQLLCLELADAIERGDHLAGEG